MIDWPQALIDDLARRRAVIFIGAGVSSASRGVGGVQPPLWREFLDRALERCDGQKQHIKRALKENDLLTVCELVRNRLDENWVSVLRQNFVDPRYQPNPLHNHIYRLDMRFVLTPNFDKIYDGLSARESENTVSVKNYYDRDIANACRDNARIVLKVHGTIDQPGEMIFTRREYARARVQYATFYRLLEAMILTHTFVFVGCSLKDPDLQLLLENHAFTYPENKPHYIVMPKVHDEIMELIRQNMNLKGLSYSPRDEHRELLESVAELVGRVDDRRQIIARENDW
jgi:SIR2-like domain